MKLSQLSYAVQREYTIPYLPHVFYATSFLILCILVLVNVALTGSDIVTTLRSDPNVVERSWWMPKFWPEFLTLSIADICQPQSITDDPTLRTNSSVPLFKYALRYANVAGEGHDPSNRIYPVPYMANPLTGCEVETILWRVDVPIRIMSYQATISCSLEGKKTYGSIRIPDDITLSMTHHRTWNTDLGPDDVKDHFAFNVVPQSRDGNNGYKIKPTQSLRTLPANSSSPNNVLAVLDGMQSDLFHALWTQKNIWVLNNTAHYDTYIVEWAASNGSYCWSGEDYDAQCGAATDLNRVLRWYGTTKDWGNGSNRAAFIQPFQVSIINSLIALRDAILIDLGNANTASNIYLNKTYFNEVIRLDPFHSDSTPTMLNTTDNYNLTEADYWNFCSWWNCIDTSWAQALRETAEDAPVRNITLPYRPRTPQAKSVFSFSYLCPTFQRKPITSLLLSVFVATVTVYSVIYRIFDLFMPKAEERYQKRTQAMRDAINLNTEDRHENYPLVRRFHTRDSSNTLYDSPGVETDKERAFDYVSTPAPAKGEYDHVNSDSYGYSIPEFDPRRRS